MRKFYGARWSHGIGTYDHDAPMRAIVAFNIAKARDVWVQGGPAYNSSPGARSVCLAKNIKSAERRYITDCDSLADGE